MRKNETKRKEIKLASVDDKEEEKKKKEESEYCEECPEPGCGCGCIMRGFHIIHECTRGHKYQTFAASTRGQFNA